MTDNIEQSATLQGSVHVGDTFNNGENGATFTPDVDEDGNLSWTNDKGLGNPEPVNIKGPRGEDGGYYTPAVTQPTDDTMEVAFTPSKAGMPAVQPATVKLPVGSGSGSSPNVNGLPEMSDATKGMFLTNNGTSASWVSIPTAEGVSF